MKVHPECRVTRTIVSMASSGQRFYEEDEAEQILNLAASLSSPMGKLSHERLLQTAEELGIPAEAVEQAERQITAAKKDRELRDQFYELQKRGFLGNACSYLAIVCFLAFYSLNHGMWPVWMILVILGWGFGVVSHARLALIRKGQAHEEAYQKWLKDGTVSQELDSPITIPLPPPPRIVVGVHIGNGDRPRRRKLRSENRDSSDG